MSKLPTLPTQPALAVPAFAAAELDLIFAAIERHKVAFRLSQVKCRIRSETVDAEWAEEYDPVECKAVEEADRAANVAAADAANALTTIRPTTMAGLLALVRHIEAFNAGAFFLEPTPPETSVYDWRSRPADWPADRDDDKMVDMFGYSVLANVRRALESLAVQS
jgi:hypothetical protein